jgi:C2 domain
VGTLEVKLVQARDLTNKDIIGKSDPFAIMYVRPLPDKMKRSKTIVSPIIGFYMHALVHNL